ncbi:hypothetical protein [Desulfonatronospira sp.]|uniref:hypothetical protein n=1 Tax=Desulfonatronospira sp. TaxID=1962951 RepID=UPI0025B8C5FF|nr:hypothetical protein [Desulfonatronospira sp.]
MTNNRTVLQARLKNCLLTIVEMEPMLSRLSIHKELLHEFKQLKEISGKLSSLELSHTEVERIENATRLFLSELEIPGEFLQLEQRENLQ